MSAELTAWSLLPPLVAIAYVIWQREVIPALLFALLSSELLLLSNSDQSAFLALFNALDRVAAVFTSGGNVNLLLFSALVGALLALVRQSGGVSAFVELMVAKGLSGSRRQVGLSSYVIGLVLFIESNVSILTAGIVSRGLYDRFGLSRERLAYIIDSTCAPVCILVLLNGWGAMVLGLLNGYGLDNPVDIMIGSIGFSCKHQVRSGETLNIFFLIMSGITKI